MNSYSDLSLRQLLDAFAEASPAPGGGSAAALAAAVGASLLTMAALIARARDNAAIAPSSSSDVLPQLQSVRQELITAIDRDAEAYSAVIAARRMPGDTDVTADRRRCIHAAAMREATEAPLATLRASRQALAAAPLLAAHCARSTAADVDVAIELLRAAVRGAALTIAANLPFIADAQYASDVDTERRRLEHDAEADADRATALIDSDRRP